MAGIALEPAADLATSAGPHVAFSPDGETIAVASWGHAELWRAHEPAATLVEPPGRHDRLAFSADGRRLLHAPDAYDLAAGSWSELGLLAVPAGFELTGAAWAPDGSELAVASRYRPPRRSASARSGPATRLALLDGRTRAELAVLLEGGALDSYSTLLVSDRLVVAADVRVLVWDRPARRSIAALTEQARAVTGLALSPTGERLAAVAADGRVAVWTTGDWRLERIWQANGDAHAAAFHPSMPWLATASGDGVRLWDLAGRPLAAVEVGRRSGGLAFDPAGGILAVAGQPPQTGLTLLRVRGSS